MKLFLTCFLLVDCFAALVPAVSNSGKAPVPAAPAAPQKRAKVDVGFAGFEKTMMEQVLASIHKASGLADSAGQWQVACKDNVTQALVAGLKNQTGALKQSIGKTWMSLPEDEQKNTYVDQLHSSFEPVFNDTIGTIDSHLLRVLKRLKTHTASKKQLSNDELKTQCAASVVNAISEERCYDLGGGQHAQKAKSFLQLENSTAKEAKKFCMPSVFEAMVRRLKDSQGLIGMTMQFESKSLSLQPAGSAVDDIVSSLQPAAASK